MTRAFSDFLDALCRTRGVQYAELARRIGVTKSYIGQLVHGHSKPPPVARCGQLADALELSPADRDRLVNLAIRERARVEARDKIEELDGSVKALCSAAADLLVGMLSSIARQDEPLPAAVAELVASDELLADLYALMNSDDADPRKALAARLAHVGPDRLAAELEGLSSALGMAPEGAAPVGRVAAVSLPIPVIGCVAAGETDIAFTDSGLPAGAGLPGEEPIPRWPGVGEQAYALRITGDSMMPLCPPGTTIVVDPDRTPHAGEPAICQAADGKSYFKLVYFDPAGCVRLVSTNEAVAADMVLPREQVRRLHKVIAALYT